MLKSITDVISTIKKIFFIHICFIASSLTYLNLIFFNLSMLKPWTSFSKYIQEAYIYFDKCLVYFNLIIKIALKKYKI